MSEAPGARAGIQPSTLTLCRQTRPLLLLPASLFCALSPCVCVSIMPPRRPRSTSNVSASNTNIARAPTASPQLKKQFALAQDSIYQNNLNVIKRRDPSVVSILDQFSHICLYNFNGKTGKWVREGYEGSIFIVEQYVNVPCIPMCPR